MKDDDEALTARILPILKRRKGFSEKKMFGGVCFLINGNMCVGSWKGSLVVRLDKDKHEETQSSRSSRVPGGSQMAFDEALAARVRPLLSRRKGFSEKKMFGGIAFFLNGHLCAGVWKEFLVVCLSPEDSEEAQCRPNVSPFNIYGREKKSWTMIAPAGLETDDNLKDWIRRAAKHAKSLPAK